MSEPIQNNEATRRFIGCEVSAELYDRYSAAARATNRSRSGLIRHLLERHLDTIVASDTKKETAK